MGAGARTADQLGRAHLGFGIARRDGGRAQLDVIVVFFLFLLVQGGRNRVAVQQDLVDRQIALQLADLVFDIQQVVVVFEPVLFKGQLLGRDLKLQRRIGQNDQRLARFHHRAIFDQHLFHRAALVGGEIIGEERRHGTAHRDVVLERALGDRADGQPVDRHAIDIAARAPERPHAGAAGQDRHSGEDGVAAPEGLLGDGAVHAVKRGARGLRDRAAAQAQHVFEVGKGSWHSHVPCMARDMPKLTHVISMPW